MKTHWLSVLLLTALSWSTATLAKDLQLTIDLPRLDVAEYHPPYVGVWIEDAKRQAEHIAVWYDLALKDGEGKEWLKDMRQWWRRGGRSLELPVDGLSGATKGPGEHTINAQLNRVLKTLAPGDYVLNVEAAREVGGREVLSIPFTWPLAPEALPLSAKGQNEVNRIELGSKP